jgi:6-pyruvoyltetrahydropterin/6-carboxytetrahydropterin synthase
MPQCGEGERLVAGLIPIVGASKNPLRSTSCGLRHLGGARLLSGTLRRQRAFTSVSGALDRQQWPCVQLFRPHSHSPLALPIVTITRRLRFNAAHRVHNPGLSDAENARIFGKCNNPNGHGHNYTLDVSVMGPVDQRTGYVMDLSDLRDIVAREVIEKLDHKNLNVDVDFLRGVNPTSENLVVACWEAIEKHIKPARLCKLRLWETEHNYVDYDGRDGPS